MPPRFPLPLTDRFALIMSAMHAAVAGRIRCPPVTAAIIVHICARLRRIAAAFATLADQIRAGTYVARAPAARRGGGAGSRAGVSPVLKHYWMGLPPWGPAWLHRVIQCDAGVWAGALREMLSEPDMAALLAAVPRLRRILRPLCFMLGVETTLLTPPPPPPGSAPAAGAEDDADTAPSAGPPPAPPAPVVSPARPPAGTAPIPDMPGAIFLPA